MATKETDSFISTDAKVLINDWQVLHNLIETHTQLTTSKIDETKAITLTTLLSERQLTDALTGPYQQFFKQKLSAYSAIAKLRLELSMRQDDSLKVELNDDQETNSAFNSLVEKYSVSDINKMQSELDQLTHEHDGQWNTQLNQWNQQLLASLTASQIPLNDIEIQEFQDNEPLSELIGRFTDLNIDLPKLDFPNFTFECYLKLKLELAIRSSLNRCHKAHESSDISHMLKKFKDDFAHINQQEKELANKQKAETQKIVQPITITKFTA